MIGRKLTHFLLLCALNTFSFTSMAGQAKSGTGTVRMDWHEAHPPRIIERKDLKIALPGYNEYPPVSIRRARRIRNMTEW